MSGGGGNSRLEGGMEAQWPLINRCGRKHVIHEIRSGGRRAGEAEFGWAHAPLEFLAEKMLADGASVSLIHVAPLCHNSRSLSA